ncbi:MAG: hypothetical protein HYT41_01825 [Candidatus Sungbacteria bacterium]|nr:hypothetical protein [Candidatus Sungbacteria bacterium]
MRRKIIRTCHYEKEKEGGKEEKDRQEEKTAVSVAQEPVQNLSFVTKLPDFERDKEGRRRRT